MFYRVFITSLCVLVLQIGSAQSLDTLEEVEVKSTRLTIRSVQSLNRIQIQSLLAEDVGEVMQKFAGITLKNYGGLGGMKTISVHGIGGAHTSIVVDGFTVQNTQTGQIDLGTVQAENSEKIAISIGGSDGFLLPVSAAMGGSTLEIQTFENSFGRSKIQVRSSLKIGSFGQYDGYQSLKWNRKKLFLSVFGKYRQAEGNFPYTLQNGLESYSGKRLNTDLKEGFAGVGAGFKLKDRTLVRINYQGNISQKGLPGAVIFYNPIAVQRLANQWHQVNADHRFVGERFAIRNYVSARYEEMTYTDRGYLNLAGVLIQDFYNVSFQHGIVTHTLLSKDSNAKLKQELTGGIEQNYSELHSSINNFTTPKRYHVKLFISDELNWKNFRLMVQLAGQFIKDEVNSATSTKQRLVVNPFVYASTKNDMKVLGRLSVWAKRSLRMPTFNELYYKEIGNHDLKPEIANQFNVGFKKEYGNSRWKVNYGFDAYVNSVENKIVAIPTKNLFIWSMQNVGKVAIVGADVQVGTHWKCAAWNFDLRANYTFQRVTDIGTLKSPTYKHQLAYFPVHTGNVDFNFNYKQAGVSISNFMIGDRYALNENIESNRVAGFWTSNIAIYYRFQIAKQQQLKITFSVKNIFNQSYAFVKYYAMPGINYLVSLNYELD